jgi:hypothetical protein
MGATEAMRIGVTAGNLCVGIGTTSPAQTLDVACDNASGQNPLRLSNHNTGANTTKYIGMEFRGTDTAGTRKDCGQIRVSPGNQNWTTGANMIFLVRSADTSSVERMRITGTGRVGIGTTAPEAPLHVVQQTLTFYFPSGYMAFYSGGNTFINGPFSAPNTPICAYFSGGRIVVGGEMDSLSDRRKKTNIKDLALALDDIRKVRITTYTMIDDGSQEYGVIAQELEEVYPLMVKNNSIEYLPTSNCFAKILETTDDLVGLTFDNFASLTQDDNVRIILESNTKHDLKVERVSSSCIYFKKWDNFDESCGIYVYGKEHRDVKTVTKNALFMANIRATQELADKIDKLEVENKSLHARLEALEKLLMKE